MLTVMRWQILCWVALPAESSLLRCSLLAPCLRMLLLWGLRLLLVVGQVGCCGGIRSGRLSCRGGSRGGRLVSLGGRTGERVG